MSFRNFIQQTKIPFGNCILEIKSSEHCYKINKFIQQKTLFRECLRKQQTVFWKLKNKERNGCSCVVRPSPCLEPVLQLLLFHVVLSIPVYAQHITHTKVNSTKSYIQIRRWLSTTTTTTSMIHITIRTHK